MSIKEWHVVGKGPFRAYRLQDDKPPACTINSISNRAQINAL